MFLFTPKWFDSAKGLEHLTWVHQAFVRIGFFDWRVRPFCQTPDLRESRPLGKPPDWLESVFVFISNSQTVPYQSSGELITS